MARIAIITDSASDLTAEEAAANGIRIVPLYVRSATRSTGRGRPLTDEFWRRMVAPEAPFPTTAAASPGDFRLAFEEELERGASAIVCVTIGGKLSATVKSAELAAQGMPEPRSTWSTPDTASMGVGLLVLLAAEMAAAGTPAAVIAATVLERRKDLDLYVALDTIEYLRKGGRISPARAAIATVLSIKPIITVVDGIVETADKVRTRARARQRVIELLTARPVERIAFLHTETPDVDAFRKEVLARLPCGVDPSHVTTECGRAIRRPASRPGVRRRRRPAEAVGEPGSGGPPAARPASRGPDRRRPVAPRSRAPRAPVGPPGDRLTNGVTKRRIPAAAARQDPRRGLRNGPTSDPGCDTDTGGETVPLRPSAGPIRPGMRPRSALCGGEGRADGCSARCELRRAATTGPPGWSRAAAGTVPEAAHGPRGGGRRRLGPDGGPWAGGTPLS